MQGWRDWLTEEDFMPLAIPLELEIEITVLKDESEAEDLIAPMHGLR